MQKSFKPYFAVIFTSYMSHDTDGYSDMSLQMENLAKQQKGYLGIYSARSEIGITVSYWETLEDIKSWKRNSDHLLAQKLGISKWYKYYDIKICEVKSEYSFESEIHKPT